jgi:RNA polymerase sigma factor (sigma-70 family)
VSTLSANIPSNYRLALAMNANDQQPSARSSRPDARQLSDTIRREQGRLLAFIRKRLPAPEDAEDVMQDVFMELMEAYELANPIERVASWLFAVARNKISDWYRRDRSSGARTISLDEPVGDDDPEAPVLMEWLAVVDEGGPESEFFRETFMDALTDALAELPSDQREVFVLHELEGKSFKEMADAWKVPVNTLLSRKRYAILHLRKRLRDLYDDFLID